MRARGNAGKTVRGGVNAALARLHILQRVQDRRNQEVDPAHAAARRGLGAVVRVGHIA